MKEYPEFLSEEQTRKYLQDIKEGKKGAKNTLAKHNFKLIDQIIKDNFNNTPYTYNVIFSLGLTGLSNAIDTYDKEKGSFTSYASECIIVNINDFLKKFPQTSLKAEGQRFAQTVIKELNLNVTPDQSPRLTNYIIDQFELNSSKQTKEILKLRYGFYERPYLEYQIAEKLKIEISEVIAVVMKYKSQIIKYAARLEISPQAIKNETLREKDVSKNIASTITSTKNNIITEPTTIYEHAAQLGYSRKDTDILLDQCKDGKINLIKTLFGEDLSRNDISNADEKTKHQFYYIVNKMKNGSKLPDPNESIYVTFNSFTKEEIDKALLSLAPETRELVYAYHGYDLENPVYVKLPNTMKKTVINIIYPRISSLLQNPELVKKPEEKKLDLNELLNLAQVLAAKNLNNTFTNKELIIFALRVGIVEDGPYCIEKICLFFDLTAEQIQTITQKVMSKFKDNFDEIYDLIMSSLYKSQIKELKGNQIKPISREE